MRTLSSWIDKQSEPNWAIDREQFFFRVNFLHHEVSHWCKIYHDHCCSPETSDLHPPSSNDTDELNRLVFLLVTEESLRSPSSEGLLRLLDNILDPEKCGLPVDLPSGLTKGYLCPTAGAQCRGSRATRKPCARVGTGEPVQLDLYWTRFRDTGHQSGERALLHSCSAPRQVHHLGADRHRGEHRGEAAQVAGAGGAIRLCHRVLSAYATGKVYSIRNYLVINMKLFNDRKIFVLNFNLFKIKALANGFRMFADRDAVGKWIPGFDNLSG